MAGATDKVRDPWWLARRVRACTLGIMALIFLLLLMYAFRMAYRIGGCDFKFYLVAARALWEGQNPYQLDVPCPYIYPLFLAFVLIPLTFIPYWLANLSWFALHAGSLVAACLVLERIASGKGRGAIDRYLPAAGIITMILMIRPLLCGFPQGQVNPVVLLCVVLCYASYAKQRPVCAGAWLGVAIAIKVQPVVLVLFLLVRRQYRILLWTLLCTALFCLLPVLVAGKALWADYETYVHNFLWPSMTHVMTNCRTHFSFAGSLAYFFPSVPSVWLKVIVGGIVAGGLLVVEMTAARRGRSSSEVWCFCAYLVACVALSPVVELHHFVLLTPAVFLLTARLLCDPSWATRAVLWWGGAFIACFNVAVEWEETRLPYFLGLVILLVLLFLAARQPIGQAPRA
jgi:hypothetical protein